MYIDYPINLEIKKKGNIEIKGKHNKGIGLWAHDKSKSTQGRGEDR
jgi:hypothetical protein